MTTEVHGCVARHLAQRPAEDIATSRWRWSPVDRGHDPSKKG